MTPPGKVFLGTNVTMVHFKQKRTLFLYERHSASKKEANVSVRAWGGGLEV